MKQTIFFLLTISFGAMVHAQENSKTNKTEVIIISNGEVINPADVEITIKKDGKKQTIDPDDVKIINKSSKMLSMYFDDEMMENMRNKMEKMLSGMGNFGFDMRDLDLNFGNNGSIREFNQEFEEFGEDGDTKKIEKNKFFLGKGDNSMLFKSDDGGPINLDSTEDELSIKREIGNGNFSITSGKEGNKSIQEIQMKGKNLQLPKDMFKKIKNGDALVLLNDEVYTGDVNMLENQTYTLIKFTNKESITSKYGEKGSKGVIFLEN